MKAKVREEARAAEIEVISVVAEEENTDSITTMTGMETTERIKPGVETMEDNTTTMITTVITINTMEETMTHGRTDTMNTKNMRDIMDKLWTFTGPRLRMIQRESLISRQSGTMSSLKSLARDMVLVTVINNNSHERKVKSLVERLGEDIIRQDRDILLGPRRDSA